MLSLCGSCRASRCHLLFICWVRSRFVGAAGPSPLIFHWNVAQAPLFFSLGLDKLCRLPAGRPAASWPAPLQPLCLFFAFPFFSFFFFPLLLLSPRLWKSSSDFPGLLSGEKDGGTFTPPPTSAFPVLPDVETPRWGDGVSSRLHRPCALGGSTSTLPPSLQLPQVQKVTSQQHREVPWGPGGSCGAVPWRSHVLSCRQTLSLQTLSLFPLS